jgi:hypothetical protein
MGAGAVVSGGPGIHQVGDGGADVDEAVPGDVQRDDDRRGPVRPPQPGPDAEGADDRRSGGQPVGPVHLGVGVQHLVVQLAGQRELGPAEEHRRDRAPGQRRDHQPAQPHRPEAERLDHPDGRVLESHSIRTAAR